MKEFAELHGKSLSTMLKEALEAQIEEAYDLKMVEEARKEDDGTRYTLEEMRHRYGL
jgi:predicted DNA-binding protein